MTKTEKIVGLRRAQGESSHSFREKVECVLAEWGYIRGADLEEQNGAIGIHTYNGANGEFIAYKFVEEDGEKFLLKWDKNGGPKDRFDAFISFNRVPKKIAQGLVKEFAKYEAPEKEEKVETPGGISDILGIKKVKGESRPDFRKRLDKFLVNHDFESIESETSDDGGFVYKMYEGKNGEIVDATFAGDNVSDDHGFDYETQEMILPYAEDSSNSLFDAALIFDGLKKEFKDRIYSGLEEKFGL
jgi:hypothetical protein